MVAYSNVLFERSVCFVIAYVGRVNVKVKINKDLNSEPKT